MSDAIYQWFTDGPWRYWLVAAPFGILWLTAALLPRRVPPWLFLVALGACLVAFRWPILVTGAEASNDESQIIAGAITLRENPVFWRDVDAHAIGPLVIYPLTILSWLGAPLNYETARIFGLIVNWLALAAGYWLIREYFGESWARVGSVPVTAFLALTHYFDFGYYSAETATMPLIAAGAAGIFIGLKRGTPLLVFLGAIALAATMWAKLQALPIAAVVFVAGAVSAWRLPAPVPNAPRATPKPGKGGSSMRRRILLALVSGLALAALLPAIAVAATGAWQDLVNSYVRAGASYVGQPETSRTRNLWNFASVGETGFPAFVWPLLIVLAVFVGAAIRRAAANRTLIATLLGAAIVAAIVVAAPGRFYPHYLQLILLPLSLAAVACLASTIQSPAVAGSRIRGAGLPIAYAALTILPQVAFALSSQVVSFDFPQGVNHLMVSDTAKLVLQNASPDARLSVWGWEPKLHVMTGLPQATREAHTQREIQQSPMRDYYRARFLADFRRSPPDIFVDAITPGNFAFQSRATSGVSTWPELGAIIALKYQLVGVTENRRVHRRIKRGTSQ